MDPKELEVNQYYWYQGARVKYVGWSLWGYGFEGENGRTIQLSSQAVRNQISEGER